MSIIENSARVNRSITKIQRKLSKYEDSKLSTEQIYIKRNYGLLH